MISIVDYGMGNLGSIQNMLKRIKVSSQIINSPDEILKATKILLPGVGAFDAAISKIDELGLRGALFHKAKVEKIPFLGICLGMQLLTNSSEEGILKGLSLIDAETIKFKFDDNRLKIPHMGWNYVQKRNESPLINNFENSSKFYFVHSYYVKCKNQNHIVMSTEYGITFDSVIQEDNVFGAQFHPEKSHKFGMKLFENFAKI
jgi:glutamine amidotransferase